MELPDAVDRKGHIPNLSYASYQEICDSKRKNTVCAIITGLFMAQVKHMHRRVIEMIIPDGRDDFRSSLAMSRPVKRCAIAEKK